MNWQYIAAHWAQYGESVRRHWGRLDAAPNAAQMHLELWQGRQPALP